MLSMKSYFAENKRLAGLTGFIWLTALVCGVYCASKAEGKLFSDTSDYLLAVLSHKSGFFRILKTGISVNIRFLLTLLITSSFLPFAPLTVALIAFKGFSAGLTSVFLIRIMKLKGALIAAGTVAVPLAAIMPIMFLMFVSALKFPIERHKTVDKTTAAMRRQNYLRYIAEQGILTLMLCLISLGEALISQIMFMIV